MAQAVDEKAMVPELRFSEFEGSWEESKGEDCFYSRRDRGEDGLPIYSVTLNDGLVPRDSLERHMENDAVASDNLRAMPDDLVYNMMRMWQGAVGLAEEECMVSPAYVVLSPKECTVSRFFDYNFSRARPLYDLWAYSYGLTNDRLRLYFKDFEKIKFIVPDKYEQQKIVRFLTAVDEKLDQLRRKHSCLKSYKRGVMQKLFSQQIRFKKDDGSAFSDWQEKKIEDVFTSRKGKGLSKDVLVENGNRKCILYGELYTTYPEIIEEVLSSTNSEEGIVSEAGDILVPCSTTTTGIDLADATVVEEGGVLLGGDISILRFRNDGCSRFFAYFLTHYKKHELAKFGQGSTIVHLYFDHFKIIDMCYPSDVCEQIKISDYIYSIDKKINIVESKITELKLFNKGLLQKMFV